MAKILETQYDEYNTKYFAGKLPKIPVRWAVKIFSDDCYGACYANHDLHSIYLSKRLCKKDSNLWKFTLLHEMVHAKLFKNKPKQNVWCLHEADFHREMKRLANRGAFNDLW